MDSYDDLPFGARPSLVADGRAPERGAEQGTGDLPLQGGAGLAGASYRELDVHIDADLDTCWCFMRPAGPPSFTAGMLRELIDVGHRLHNRARAAGSGERPVRYFVGGSRIPRIYNLGGDLRHFVDRIRAGDRDGLRHYARACIDVAYAMSSGFELGTTTIALVQGDALGGGFEGALSFNVLIAERSAKFGLPEILFNLFPGMGAYTYLARRLDGARAERMIMGGRIYTAEELHQLGLIDVLAEDGQGIEAVRNYIRGNRTNPSAGPVCRGDQSWSTTLYGELRDITDIWVDTAFQLTEADLRRMERLAAAQERRLAKTLA